MSSERRTRALVALASLGLAVRLWLFVRAYASDLVFWDQWDFLTPLFEGSGLLALFRRQHGPHRQGLGGLVIGVVYPLTHWNLRADAYLAALAVAAACALAVAAIWRLTSRARLADLALPLLFLAPTPAEIYVSATNPAHGPLPLLLAMIAAWALGRRDRLVRAGVLGLVGASAVYTGFAIFLAPPIACLLAVDAVRALRSGARVEGAGALAAGLLLCASAASFAIGYQFSPAIDCYRFPDPRPWLYVPFAGLQLLRPYASYLNHLGAPVIAGASCLFALSAALSLRALWRILGAGRTATDETVFLLSSFSLLFALDSAVGRVCSGLSAASSTRYVVYALPMATALYLTLRTARLPPRAATLAPLAFLCVALASAASQGEAYALARSFKNWKESWRACYLARHDLAACNRETRAVYPDAAATHQQEKLDFLEAHHLSLFR